jgi:hypothetical protein
MHTGITIFPSYTQKIAGIYSRHLCHFPIYKCTRCQVSKLSRSTFQQSSLGGELERHKGELKGKKPE